MHKNRIFVVILIMLFSKKIHYKNRNTALGWLVLLFLFIYVCVGIIRIAYIYNYTKKRCKRKMLAPLSVFLHINNNLVDFAVAEDFDFIAVYNIAVNCD